MAVCEGRGGRVALAACNLHVSHNVHTVFSYHPTRGCSNASQ